FALLVAFVRSPGRVLSRAQLRNAIEPQNVDAFDRSIDMLVARLRRKVEPNPTVPRIIITIAGVGYKFAARVSKEYKSPPSSEVEQRAETGEGRIDPHEPQAAPTTAPAYALASPHSEPHRRQLTALSCGLIGSTSLALNLDAEELGEILR